MFGARASDVAEHVLGVVGTDSARLAGLNSYHCGVDQLTGSVYLFSSGFVKTWRALLFIQCGAKNWTYSDGRAKVAVLDRRKAHCRTTYRRSS